MLAASAMPTSCRTSAQQAPEAEAHQHIGADRHRRGRAEYAQHVEETLLGVQIEYQQNAAEDRTGERNAPPDQDQGCGPRNGEQIDSSREDLRRARQPRNEDVKGDHPAVETWFERGAPVVGGDEIAVAGRGVPDALRAFSTPQGWGEQPDRRRREHQRADETKEKAGQHAIGAARGVRRQVVDLGPVGQQKERVELAAARRVGPRRVRRAVEIGAVDALLVQRVDPPLRARCAGPTARRTGSSWSGRPWRRPARARPSGGRSTACICAPCRRFS